MESAGRQRDVHIGWGEDSVTLQVRATRKGQQRGPETFLIPAPVVSDVLRVSTKLG